ncbi:hypothetical protein JW921_03065 [Candidatus Fermentibacterales bacterium]|nr:hypothetical protein [Candidatus Fermentibacterales bacterium]
MVFGFRSLLRSRRRNLIESRGGIHLPGSLRSPSSILVASGTGESDVWAALFLCDSLQRHYGPGVLHVMCRKEDESLFSLLEWSPELVCAYGTDRRGAPEGQGVNDLRGLRPDMLFFPYDEMSDAMAGVLLEIRPTVLSSLAANEAVNLRVRLDQQVPLPERIHRFCRILGISPHPGWKPRCSRQDAGMASELLAPVSGRALPYIVASEGAAALLREAGEEVPLKLVQLSGKGSLGAEAVPRSVRAAVVQEASAVATDDASLWAEACFFGARVVGLDPSGSFQTWRSAIPCQDRASFFEGWERLIREGWE